MRPMIQAIARDITAGKPAGHIAACFHNTVAAVVSQVCLRIRRQEGLHRVCLSGGVFQNMYLLERSIRNLRRDGFEVYLHAQVPPNDGGISLGQAVIANELLTQEG